MIPWALRGLSWEAGSTAAPLPEACSECAAALGAGALVLVRHRGEHRIADGFCSAVHLTAWAKAGGRWRVSEP